MCLFHLLYMFMHISGIPVDAICIKVLNYKMKRQVMLSCTCKYCAVVSMNKCLHVCLLMLVGSGKSRIGLEVGKLYFSFSCLLLKINRINLNYYPLSFTAVFIYV